MFLAYRNFFAADVKCSGFNVRSKSNFSKLCQNIGMDFMDSPCDFEAIELANSVDMDILKVASFDIVFFILQDQLLI